MADAQKPDGPDTKEKAKRKPFHEEFAEKIIARLQEGTAPWQQPWHPGSGNFAPHNPASGTVYKGVNRLSLSMSGHDDPHWMTLKQANDKGMSIVPGSKSTPVIYYQFSEEKDRVGEDDIIPMFIDFTRLPDFHQPGLLEIGNGPLTTALTHA